MVHSYHHLADRSAGAAKALIAQLENGEAISPPIVTDDGYGAATTP